MAKKISEQAAHALLEKLSTDDSFREQLLGDPVAAMASLGVDVDHSEVPAKRTLPSKDDVKAARDALHARLNGAAGMGVLFL